VTKAFTLEDEISAIMEGISMARKGMPLLYIIIQPDCTTTLAAIKKSEQDQPIYGH
jgi:hypothetical protein